MWLKVLCPSSGWESSSRPLASLFVTLRQAGVLSFVTLTINPPPNTHLTVQQASVTLAYTQDFIKCFTWFYSNSLLAQILLYGDLPLSVIWFCWIIVERGGVEQMLTFSLLFMSFQNDEVMQ